MAVHIRLSRGGTKKKPFYRVVVTDQRSPRDGDFLENIGTFDPLVKDEKVVALKLDQTRYDFWRQKGARPSATLDRLVKRAAKAALAAAK
jgi:small subunit ribosomal protein S16